MIPYSLASNFAMLLYAMLFDVLIGVETLDPRRAMVQAGCEI
jgi:hypothetical protein